MSKKTHTETKNEADTKCGSINESITEAPIENVEQKTNISSIDLENQKDIRIAELTDTLQRLQADFENYKKRVEKEKQQFAKVCNYKFMTGLLPIIDALDLALKSSKDSVDKDKDSTSKDYEKFRQGIQMIFNQLKVSLEAEGLRPIECVGKKLDPYYHDVLLQEESEKDGIVIQELQKGYMLNDLILRHSKVKVGKKK